MASTIRKTVGEAENRRADAPVARRGRSGDRQRCCAGPATTRRAKACARRRRASPAPSRTGSPATTKTPKTT